MLCSGFSLTARNTLTYKNERKRERIIATISTHATIQATFFSVSLMIPTLQKPASTTPLRPPPPTALSGSTSPPITSYCATRPCDPRPPSSNAPPGSVFCPQLQPPPPHPPQAPHPRPSNVPTTPSEYTLSFYRYSPSKLYVHFHPHIYVAPPRPTCLTHYNPTQS